MLIQFFEIGQLLRSSIAQRLELCRVHGSQRLCLHSHIRLERLRRKIDTTVPTALA